jgi:DNA-binding LacI/PurR family transcriptional regulator
MGNITLQTIADHLGISRTSVSNAFNRPDQLSDELRQSIIATATELGYTGPHAAARTLRSGRAGAYGVVLTESLAHAFDNPYSMGFLAGIARETETSRLGLYLIPCPPGSDQVAGVRDAVVDGFCVFTLPDSHPVVDAVLGRNLPAVFVDGPRIANHGFVGIDDRAATVELASRLISLGHRQVGIITFRLAPDDRVGVVEEHRRLVTDYRVTRERLSGAMTTLGEAGSEPVIFEIGEDLRSSAEQAALELLRRSPRPTALMCTSDEIALGVLDAATTAGLSVPNDLSVTGFDGIAEAIHAGVTTVSQPSADKGQRAMQLLASNSRDHVILPYTLIPGETVAVASI